jgi:hypothetical protein
MYNLVRACDTGFTQLDVIDLNRRLSRIVRNLTTDQHCSNLIEHGGYVDYAKVDMVTIVMLIHVN